jgi:hypothetical protein
MIYLDISAAVHSKAGLGRYSERLAGALIARHPDRYALFYNRGADGRFPDSLPDSRTPQRHVHWGYKPWRMMVLLGQIGRVPFEPADTGCPTIPQHRTPAFARERGTERPDGLGA